MVRIRRGMEEAKVTCWSGRERERERERERCRYLCMHMLHTLYIYPSGLSSEFG